MSEVSGRDTYRGNLHLYNFLSICFVVETVSHQVSKIPQRTFEAVGNCFFLTLQLYSIN